MSDNTTIAIPTGPAATVWRRSPETKGSDRPVLLGARIRPEWLDQTVSLLAVRLTGSLLSSLQALLETAKVKDDKNLPIVRLRALFMAKLEGVVRLDRDLGLRDLSKAVLEMRCVGLQADEGRSHDDIKQEIADILMRWYQDVVASWAERNGLTELASSVRSHIAVGNIDLQLLDQRLVVRQAGGGVAKPQWDLIAKHLAERLVGEELFPGLGPCELIADASSLEGAVELTTWPTKALGSDTAFSMVARLSVATWPTGRDIRVKITPVKRVWARKVPSRKPNAPSNVRCYVFSAQNPVLPATIRRGKDGWEFGDDYVQYLAESSGELPHTLQRATESPRPSEPCWWVGVPELTTLYDYVQQRTVFESDEVDLRDRIVELIPDVLDPALPFRVLKIPRAMTQAKSEVARLQIDDVIPAEAANLGWAGAALALEPAAEDAAGEPTDNVTSAAKRRERLERHRLANEEALEHIHEGCIPSLWVFVDGTLERQLIERSARAILGDRVRLEFSPLPAGVHGLRADLDAADEKGSRRFEVRVERWKSVAEQVAGGAQNARHVLICAPKDVGNRPEDPVNYFAGLHAMSSHGKANVHHLLPLETDRRTGQPDVQHFIHRVQSALLDVFLAHSGVVFGVKPFVNGCLGPAAPMAIYGVQAIRSQARAFTQEQPVSLIVITRLDTASGVTSVSFACRNRNRIQTTDWLPLNQGLQWLGSQRQLSGDERWLKESFAGITRKALGKINEQDPRAVVLIDWATVAGLWKEISDESLIAAAGTRRGIVLDDADLGKAFPQMTLLRLRADRNATMVMRWMKTRVFEEMRTDPRLEPTGQIVEEQYATTYQTIVELDPKAMEAQLPHYLVVMGYRNTVQTKRGMSCYRPRSRMSRNKSDWWERRLMPVAKDNAGLPSGLEVTVLQAPSAVKPDSLASLVMGLRLGYAHYDDWTALPAPLFFVRKVRDYIIRYPETGETAVGDTQVSEPELPSGEDTPAEDLDAASGLRSELVAEVLAGLPELEAADVEAVTPEPAPDAIMEVLEGSQSSAAPVMGVDEAEPLSLDTPDLQRALEAGLAAPELYLPSSGIAAKQLYESMLLGDVRVRVDPPWYVTKETVLPTEAWPKDKRAIGRYWHKLGQFPLRLRPDGGKPSVALFPDWVIRRLAVPQSLYALDISKLLPTTKPLFYRIYQWYDLYLEEVGKLKDEPAKGQFWRDLPDLVAYLAKRREDEALGWAFCLLAHHPYKDILPKVLKAADPEALGPYAVAGLQYMTSCYVVCRQAYDDKRKGSLKGKTYVVAGIARPAGLAKPLSQATPLTSFSVLADTETPSLPVSDVQVPSVAADTITASAVSSTAEANVARPLRSYLVESPSERAPATSAPPDWPVPGSESFATELDACQTYLERIKIDHDEILASRQAQRLAEQERRAQLELAAVRAVWLERLHALDKQASEVIANFSDDLEVGAWRVADAVKAIGDTPDEPAMEAVLRQLQSVRKAINEASEASREVQTIDSGDFEGAQELSFKERMRRKTSLLPAALSRLNEAESNLQQALEACCLFAPDVADGAEGVSHPAAAVETPAPSESLAGAVEPLEPNGDVAEAGSDVEPSLQVNQEGELITADKEASAPVEAIHVTRSPERVSDHGDSLPVAHNDGSATGETSYLEEEEEETFPDLPTPGPLLLTEPAQKTFSDCLRAGQWALAGAEAAVLREVVPGPASRLWSVAAAILRSADMRTPVDTETLGALQDWLTEAATHHAAPHSFAEHLGVLGASLLPMLLPGNTPGVRWAAIEYLRPRLQQHAELHAIVERISTLDSIQLVMTPEILSAAKVSLQQALEDGVARMRQRARNWATDQALVTNWAATDYIQLHAAICTDKRGFAAGACIAAIARGDDARARALLPEVQKLAEKGLATINDLRKRIGRKRPIEGVGRDYLVQNLQTTAQFARDFVESLGKVGASKHAALPAKHEDFLKGLYRDLKAALEYVRQLDLTEDAAGVHRQVLLCALEAALSLMEQRAPVNGASEADQLLLLRYPLAHDMEPLLAWSPSKDADERVPIAEVGQLHAAVEQAARDLQRAGVSGGTSTTLQSLLLEAAEDHRRAERLLLARFIAERLEKVGRSVAASLSEANDAAYRNSRSKLKLDLQEARQRVTNALSLSAVTQAEASRMLKVIESLIRGNESQDIATPSKPGALYPDFPHARAVLQQIVLSPLEARIADSRERLKLEIEDFVSSQRGLNLEPPALRQLEHKKQRMLATLEKGTALDVRVARSEFLLLREGKLPSIKFDERRSGQVFEAFCSEIRKVTQGHRLLDGLARVLSGAFSPQTTPEWLGALTSAEREEATQLLGAWQAIFKSLPREEGLKALKGFFRAAGVSQEPTLLAPNEGRFFLDGKPFAGLSASDFAVFVPPALGSDATHVQGIVVPPHPASPERLGQRVAQLSASTPTFVLTRQNLTVHQRAQLGRDHQVLLIDDDLVAYIAVHPAAERLAKLLEVCLLSFRTNPYADYGNRPVPPEMFFGRTQELTRLRAVPSAAVLYGGRRLGKSSLLNQILEESKAHLQETTDRKALGEMAIYVPLDSGKDPAGFSQNYLYFAWKGIHKALVSTGFIDRCMIELKTDQEIRERIQSEINAGRSKTNACYLLIDEADDVMRQDLLANSAFLASLQALSDEIIGNCRMRYVIAGLHNLTRMTTGVNTALGKATSIALQPFSSDMDIIKGVELITKPLAALGFHFAKGDEGLPLRIMAVCNFYPAFIQLYCRNLVERLYNKRAGKDLTNMVGSEDLDAVERDQEFLQEIREKFGLNLNLDKRYKAIALILAEHSYAEPADSVFAGLTATEIRDHCATYAPEHFKTTAPGAYEALLDEMEKLTILERNGSRFQLRTPDIATMLGDKEQVAHLLNELARETPTEERSHGEARLSLTHKSDAKTFPMPSAWLRNFMRGSPGDLAIFVGNQLSGISVFERLRDLWDLPQDDATIEARIFSSPEDARNYLNSARRKVVGGRIRLVGVLPRGWHLDQLESYAALAQSFGRPTAQAEGGGRTRLAAVRPMLIAGPEQALALALRQGGAGKPLPKNAVIAAIPPWSDDAVYFRFNQAHHENLPIRDSADARRALLFSSCGFGDELERMAAPSLTVDEALRTPEDARKRLAPSLDAFYARIGMPSAVDAAMRKSIEDLLISMHGQQSADAMEDEHFVRLNILPGHFLFAQWMGLIQPTATGTWEVPSLYLDLLLA